MVLVVVVVAKFSWPNEGNLSIIPTFLYEIYRSIRGNLVVPTLLGWVSLIVCL